MQKFINDWAPETKSLCERLVAAGFTLVSGDNGEDRFKFKEGELDKFIDNLIACDEARIYVKSPEGKKIWLYLVLGNCPGELVSDYICHDLLDEVTDAHYEEWSVKAQPMKEDKR